MIHAARLQKTDKYTYNTYVGMIQRCYREKNVNFRYYGAEGIRVCDRWHDAEMFYHDMGPRPQGTTLSRKNHSKDYSPDNCIWEEAGKNSGRKRTNRLYQIEDMIMSVAAWAKWAGLHRGTVGYRLSKNPSIIEALAPARKGKPITR